jgi:ribosomal protein S18 acetylase RimI-like enzyme
LATSLVDNGVIIRDANGNDYEWVADLMVRALSPFYDGDHRARARHIFDTYTERSTDRASHSSAEQYMFIAEIDGRQVGIIRVVKKKQGTVKISPLIISTDHRGKLGIGSTLLEHAEDLARNLGARQLYCTVASPNQKALDFFLKKGFRITGTAKDHYKRGINEHMLYKQLGNDRSFDLPNVSVVLFNERKHADGVRKLILQQIGAGFLEVNDDWVNALLAGYAQQNTTDSNVTRKIILVAECDGEIAGVAAATPKKGSPIKLMPLAALNETALDVLIVELQELLVSYGHKLYVHLVPEAWQVICLQRHGWTLEGVLPGGYAPSSVVQQWGFSFDKEK